MLGFRLVLIALLSFFNAISPCFQFIIGAEASGSDPYPAMVIGWADIAFGTSRGASSGVKESGEDAVAIEHVVIEATNVNSRH